MQRVLLLGRNCFRDSSVIIEKILQPKTQGENLFVFGWFAIIGFNQKKQIGDEPFFIHAIEADERGGQACQLLFYAFFRHVCRNIVQCCIGHGFIAVFRRAADEHRRSIIPEIIIASHMHSAIPICKRECCTAELRSLNFHGEKGQGCLRNDIDHGLIVPDTVTDHVIKTVTVSDVHAIEIESVRISGQLLNAVQCLDTVESI